MAKARVGYALGYGKFTNVREMADVMKQAEERGFEMAFFSETIELMRDSVSSLTAISLATKNMIMGTTQIVRLRGPVVMAQSLATLDELSGGRMTAAPGACTKSHARVHALPQDVGATPSEVLREYIESMRLLFTGEKVSYHGKFVNFDNVGLGWKPVRSHIPFYVPATATVGLKLAGAVGDGVILNAVCSPEYTVNALRDHQGVGAAGRARLLQILRRADHQLFHRRQSQKSSRRGALGSGDQARPGADLIHRRTEDARRRAVHPQGRHSAV